MSELKLINESLEDSRTLPDGTVIGGVELHDSSRDRSVMVLAPATLSEEYNLVLPVNNGSTDQVLRTDGSGVTSWVDQSGTTYTAGDGLDLSVTEFSTDLKANGGVVIESTELAVDLGASSITGTLAVSDGGTGLTSISTLLNANVPAYTAGDGLDLSVTEFSTDLKANGGVVIESTELAVDLGASSITGTLAVSDGGTGLTSISTLLNANVPAYTAGDGLELTGTTFSADLKAVGGLVIEANELAVNLGATAITGTLGASDGGTGLTSISTLLNANVSAVSSLTVSGDLNVTNSSSSNDDPIMTIHNTSDSYGESTLLVKANYDCSLRMEGLGGEAYMEIANTSLGTGSTIDSWGIGCNDTMNLHFSWGTNNTLNKTDIMVLHSAPADLYSVNITGDVIALSYSSFTGAHLCMGKSLRDEHIGLICQATNKIMNMDNSVRAKLSETLPIIELCATEKSKRVLGVLSGVSGSESFKNVNETRCKINALGEGSMWVINKNGSIEIGDYITSSSVPGYGQKQTETQVHNFTVAKSLSDCSFSLTKISKQKVKITTSVQTISKGSESITKTLTTLVLDSSGNVQFEDDLDSTGNQQMVYPHDTRFLLADGTQITESDYTTRLSNNESVYIACFIGCTYHCG